MQTQSKKFLTGLVLLLAAGGFIGWLYGHTERGLLIASLFALAWQVRHLLAFVRGIQTGDFSAFRIGEGVWEQIFAHFSYREERAEKYKKRYRELLREIRKSTNAMPDGAVILDCNNEIVNCNRAAKALAGLKRKKDRGQRVDNILRHPKLTELLHLDDASQAVEISSPLKPDTWLNCRVVPYGPDQKLLLIRDVTERIRLSHMRRDFVANASHELRSPLTVISGYLDSLAEDSEMPADWNEPVGQMRIQARRMNRIVAELLELSRLESAGSAEESEPVDVGALLAPAAQAFHKPGLTATIDVAVESTAQLLGNQSEIESVITNLVSNAVQHTPGNGRISLCWRSDAKGAELSVEDTGEGIDREYLPRLTERFFRADRGRAREKGGVGLGLAIVKHALSRHDAELSIDSEPGKGSRFSCRFPPERIVTKPPILLVNEPAGGHTS